MAEEQEKKSVTILYFASLSEQLGIDKETCDLSSNVTTIEHLKNHLAQRPGPWSAILEQNILCACNQEMAAENQPIHHNDEIAFFPPVTGG